jgi:hypothetical protein
MIALLRFRPLLPLTLLTLAASCGSSVVDQNGATTSGGAGGTSTAGNPLVGTWSGSAGGPTRLVQTLVIGADGTVLATDAFEVLGSGATPCSGALQITDTWTSTATTFSVSGGTCTGSVSCPNEQDIPCGAAETTAQTCSYALSGGDDTLTLDCPEGNASIVLTRTM